jgi:hypothetical protein
MPTAIATRLPTQTSANLTIGQRPPFPRPRRRQARTPVNRTSPTIEESHSAGAPGRRSRQSARSMALVDRIVDRDTFTAAKAVKQTQC